MHLLLNKVSNPFMPGQTLFHNFKAIYTVYFFKYTSRMLLARIFFFFFIIYTYLFIRFIYVIIIIAGIETSKIVSNLTAAPLLPNRNFVLTLKIRIKQKILKSSPIKISLALIAAPIWLSTEFILFSLQTFLFWNFFLSLILHLRSAKFLSLSLYNLHEKPTHLIICNGEVVKNLSIATNMSSVSHQRNKFNPKKERMGFTSL